jgi:diguanylate cyclase (GGDEF)-like protein
MNIEPRQWIKLAQAFLEARDLEVISSLATTALEDYGVFQQVQIQLGKRMPTEFENEPTSIKDVKQQVDQPQQPVRLYLHGNDGIVGIFHAVSGSRWNELNEEDIEYYDAILQLAVSATEQQWSYRHMETLSMLDDLTGCYNRRYLFDLLQREIDMGKRRGLMFSVIMLDLNNLKGINDRHGHLAGDQALKEFGSLLRNGVRSIDVVCRYGGDEFVIILPQTATIHAKQIGKRLIDHLKTQAIELEQEQLFLNACVGVSQFPDDGMEIETLLEKADQQCYLSKQKTLA